MRPEQRTTHFRLRHAVSVLMTCWLLPQLVHAQQSAFLLPQSASHADLLKRAEDGIRNQDWKLVVDAYQRIIDSSENSMWPREGPTSESARRHVYRLLKSLPPDALRTYHLLYDGLAQTTYDEAIANHDIVALEQLTNQYLMTNIGCQASITLAYWHLEQGSSASALAVLSDAAIFRQNTPEQTTQVNLLRAVAAHLMGDSHQAALPSTPNRQLIELTKQVQAFLATPIAPADKPHEHWSMENGDSQRLGRMPLAVPALIYGLPWRYDLPYQLPIPWTETMQVQEQRGLYPLSQMVADKTRLYVNCDRQLIALNLVNFDLEWSTTWRSDKHAPDRRRRRTVEASRRNQALSTLLLDSVGAQVSKVGNLVFTLERSEFQNPFRLGRQSKDYATEMSNVLVARDINASGKIVWTCDQSDNFEDALHGACFVAAPVGIGDRLVLPYWKETDYFLAVLDPKSGSLLNTIHLCTLTNGTQDLLTGAAPAVDDQLMIIGTNNGLVLALNVDDLSLRWATTYDAQLAPNRSPDHGWLAGPPIIQGSRVLLASAGGNTLMALDRTNGAILWHRPRGDYRYIIAADHQSIWVGGSHLARLSLTDGQTLWRTEIGNTTARCVLSENRIIVPRRDGLRMISATSGEVIDSFALPADQAPLGSLLSWQGALYSVDSQQVRKFPDLEQSYEPAKSAHDKDPSDTVAAIRLAWMELLKKQPQLVLDALSHVDVANADARQRSRITHLKVQALLLLAKQHQGIHARQPLMLAHELAESDQNRLSAVMALSRFLRSEQEYDIAYEKLWHALLRQDRDFMVNVTPELKRSAWQLMSEELNRIFNAMNPSHHKDLAQQLSEDHPFTKHASRSHRSVLARLSLCRGPKASDQQAALILGQQLVELLQYEKAEHYLRQAAANGSDPSLTNEALYQLINMYLSKDLMLWHLAKPLVTSSAQGMSDEKLAAVQQQVHAIRELALEKFGLDLTSTTDQTPTAVSLPGYLLSTSTQLLDADVVLTLTNPNRLSAYRVSTGELRWQSDLKLLTTTTSNPSPSDAGRPHRDLYAKNDGQLVVVNTATGLHGVGAITGRRLWSSKINNPSLVIDDMTATNDFYDVAQGYVAVRADAHRIELRRSVDGSLVWQLEVPEFVVDRIDIRGPRIVLVDEDSRTAVGLDLSTGERVYTRTFSSNGNALPTSLLLYDHILCGYHEGSLAAMDHVTGQFKWTKETPPNMQFLAQASAHCIVLGNQQGEISVLDPISGQALFEGSVPIGGLGLVDAVHVDDMLFIIGRGQAFDGRDTEIAAVDLARRDVRWAKQGLAVPLLSANAFEQSETLIPLVYRMSGDHRAYPEALADMPQAVVYLDKSSGHLIGEAQELLMPRTQDSLTSEFVLFKNNRLIVNTLQGTAIVMVAPPRHDDSEM